MNSRDESYVLHSDYFPGLYIFFVLAIGSPLLLRGGRILSSYDPGGLEIIVLFEVTVRRITVVLRKLVVVVILRKIPGPCFSKYTREY